MDMKVGFLIGFSFLYAGFEVFMNVRQGNRQGKTIAVDDRGSLWALSAAITLGYSLSFAIGATKLGRVYAWDTFFAIGATLIALGLIIRIHSLLTLGRYFSYSVARVDDQPLLESGLYRVIRHPGYLGQLLVFLGMSISLSNGLAILAMMLPVMLGYGYRIRVEERFMLEQFGKKYLDYQQRTKRLIPLVF